MAAGPANSPTTEKKIRDTRVMFGCVEVAVLEDLLDRLFSDDLRFVQSGVRRPRRRSGTPSGQRAQTYRGSFRVDDAGDLVPGSFEYAPLIDFARGVEDFLKGSSSIHAAVSHALAFIDSREMKLLAEWDTVVESAVVGYPAVSEVLRKVRVRDDHTRYCTQWIWPDDQPAGQLPAFFRDDLLQAAEHKTSPLLAGFLAGRADARSAAALDLDQRSTLEPLLDPELIPRAAWPTGHVLRLSQQVALTAILADEADPLMVVNGPPGTGKTTLLRDLYANLVSNRAKVMVTYEDPTSAFGAHRDVPSMNSQRWSIYPPAEKLCGFEMLVASSNNAAVEHVTKELPDAGEVKGEVGARLHYFGEAANLEPAGASDPKTPGFRPGLLPIGKHAWGFAAAALGSRDRVGTFETVVGRYLSRNIDSSALLRALGQRPAAGEWEQARKRFCASAEAVESAITATRRAVAESSELADLIDKTNGKEQARLTAEAAVMAASTDVETARADVTRFEGAATAARLRLEQSNAQRPNWWSRWWRTERYTTWQSVHTNIAHTADETATEYSARATVLNARQQAEASARSTFDAAIDAERANRDRVTELRRTLGTYTAADRSGWVTADWWARRHDPDLRAGVELGSAWVNPRLQRLREEVFEAAMHVHEVFARSCSRQVTANLRTWLALQSNEVQRQSADEATLSAWQSLFLVVPLVSTTFASMARLLQRVPIGSLGWLIVDEAGQAMPAAAVGGLARFQRAVIVGDPLQLEPVVTLPRALIDQLLHHHGAPPELAPTRASVQTLADSVSRLGTMRGGRWISMPLLVHNRCLDPMFTVANEIAYENQMIQGRTRPSAVGSSLGPSRWIDVPRRRDDDDHFNEGDWAEVLGLLAQVDWDAQPSIAIISPFKRVTRTLSTRVPNAIRAQLPPTLTEEEIARALDAVRVGTVHTFQGREYEMVILVLGGATGGARSWAAGTPNLFNVAVTRAKDRLYVIGDLGAWESVGHAAKLAEHLT